MAAHCFQSKNIVEKVYVEVKCNMVCGSKYMISITLLTRTFSQELKIRTGGGFFRQNGSRGIEVKINTFSEHDQRERKRKRKRQSERHWGFFSGWLAALISRQVGEI